MYRRGPLITLGSVVAFGAILLVANILIIRPVGAAPAHPAARTLTATRPPAHALYTGRSSDNDVTVAIAVNGRKAAGFLHFGFHGGVAPLRGSESGSQIVLTGQGARLTGIVSGPAVFGTVTVPGESVPFSAQLSVIKAAYTGRSSGNEVTLAISTDGDKAAAYVCNGRTVEAWLQGSVSGNQVSLSGRNGAGLSGSISGLDIFGTVSPVSGKSFPFSAELSPRPAGPYRADVIFHGLATVIGWTVLPDGTQAGVLVAGGTRQSAPMLDLSNGSFALGGASFTAVPVAGNATVVNP